MKTFGHFDDAHREYVITDPRTPWPWINYLGNEDFFSLISNTAGGYTFCKDAKFRRITRYRYNNVPMDNGGRYFYINDGGTVWSPGWKPCKTPLDFYECRHGMSYTRITGAKDGLEASVLFFVPLGVWGEVQKMTLRNTSGAKKSFKLYSFTEWCLWNAATDMENFQRNWSTGEVEIDGSVIYHKTEYKERRDHYAYYAVTNAKIDGYDTDRESFIGLYNEFADPQCVMAGKPGNSLAHGWSPIASHYIEVELKPGESKDYIFVLGYVENKLEEKFCKEDIARKKSGELISSQDSDVTLVNKTKAKELIKRFSTVAAVDAAFAELANLWDILLDKYAVKSDDEKLNRMVNIWSQYQCMITFNFSRSASFFESGVGRGMGSGSGKTAGRGHKGQKARSGSRKQATFQGGQMPILRRFPKFGFNNPFAKQYVTINLGDIEKFIAAGKIDASKDITIDSLLAAKIINRKLCGLKVLAKGEIKSSVNVVADKWSKAAEAAIVKAGGTIKNN